ncbi:MAG: hypothetical protein ACTMKU_06420, partial [Actinomycetaceae bacterium]
MTGVKVLGGGSAIHGRGGWSIEAGVWEVVGEYMPAGRAPWFDDDGELLPIGWRPGAAFSSDVPFVMPFERFYFLDGSSAARLLDRLPDSQLDASEGGAPTLRTALRAAATHPDSLYLHGWGFIPGVATEGVVITALTAFVADGFGVGEHDYCHDHERSMVWGSVLE